MQGSLSLLETIQTSFLAQSKSKHELIKRGISILNGQEVDETKTPLQYFQVDQQKVEPLISWAFYILRESKIPDDIQQYTNDDCYTTIFLMLFEFYHEAIRMRVNEKQFIETLKSFHLQQTYVKLFSNEYNNNYADLTSLQRLTRVSQPSLDSIEWRIDIIISTASLNKAFVPIILFQLTTSNGDIKTVECDIPTFHKLRYSTAKMLANMQAIDQHPTLMRLVD